MESKFKYRFTQKTNCDLDNIISYIDVELSNPKAASDFVDKLLDAIEEICSFPECGSLVENEYMPKPDVRKKRWEIILCILCPILEKKQFLF